MQHLTNAIEALDHLATLLDRMSPFTALVLVCVVAFSVIALGFGVLGYVVHKLR